jgi:hypothetical protein
MSDRRISLLAGGCIPPHAKDASVTCPETFVEAVHQGTVKRPRPLYANRSRGPMLGQMESPRLFETAALERQLSTATRRAGELEAQLATARERYAAFPNDVVSAHRIAHFPLEIAAARATIAAIREELSQGVRCRRISPGSARAGS